MLMNSKASPGARADTATKRAAVVTATRDPLEKPHAKGTNCSIGTQPLISNDENNLTQVLST